MIQFGPYQLDRAQGLRRDGQEVRLTPKSLSVLCALAARAGEVVSKEELFGMVWANTAVTDSALTSCIQELRQALHDDPRRPQFIETLHRRGYRFRAQTSSGPPSAHTVLPGPPLRTETPVVGREAILEDMSAAYARAEQGDRQVLFITGEPGIGKTTVVQAFCSRLTARRRVRTTWGQCVQHYGVGEPYQPLLVALSRLCGQPGGDRFIPLLERHSPTWLAQLPSLLAPERIATLKRTVAGTTRERMLRELTDAIEVMTAETPLILWLEDLHWSDMSTLDWVAAFAQRPERARFLLIGTFRPPAERSGNPLAAVSDGLRFKGFCHEIALGGLEESAVCDFAALRFPPASGHGAGLRRLGRRIHQHTVGNPFFVVNVMADLAKRGLLEQEKDVWKVTGDADHKELGIPHDVQRMIEQQVDRLRPTERAVLEIASVAGAAFSAPTVAAAAGLGLNEIEMTFAALAREQQFVREAGAVEWPDRTLAARFEFLHVLYREVLYQRVPAGRRTELHRLVAAREEAAYGERSLEIAAELAMHFEQSRDLRRAGVYLQHAAENARARGSYREAQTHFEHALTLLVNEPLNAERSAREMALQIGRGAVIMANRGWSAPEAEEAYSRARTLSHELGNAPGLFPALWGLWLFYWGRGPLTTAYELAQELLVLARQRQDEASLLQAQHAGWATCFAQGYLQAASVHATDGIDIYRTDKHAAMAVTYGSHDAGVCARNFLSWAQALLGRTDDATRTINEAVILAQRLGHPFSLALTHVFAAAAEQTLRDAKAAKTHAAAAVSIAREQDFRLLLLWASVLAGWAEAEQGQHQEGLNQIGSALAELRATGSNSFLPYFLGLYAEAHFKCGQASTGLGTLDEAFAVARSTGERFWDAELLRLKGELLLTTSAPAATQEGEQSLIQAIDIAREQGAHLLFLRASISLGRLWQRLQQGTKARKLVAKARANIAPGITSPDVSDADTFLGR